jgi:hypothetical protein
VPIFEPGWLAWSPVPTLAPGWLAWSLAPIFVGAPHAFLHETKNMTAGRLGHLRTQGRMRRNAGGCCTNQPNGDQDCRRRARARPPTSGRGSASGCRRTGAREDCAAPPSPSPPPRLAAALILLPLLRYTILLLAVETRIRECGRPSPR